MPATLKYKECSVLYDVLWPPLHTIVARQLRRLAQHLFHMNDGELLCAIRIAYTHQQRPTIIEMIFKSGVGSLSAIRGEGPGLAKVVLCNNAHFPGRPPFTFLDLCKFTSLDFTANEILCRGFLARRVRLVPVAPITLAAAVVCQSLIILPVPLPVAIVTAVVIAVPVVPVPVRVVLPPAIPATHCKR